MEQNEPEKCIYSFPFQYGQFENLVNCVPDAGLPRPKPRYCLCSFHILLYDIYDISLNTIKLGNHLIPHNKIQGKYNQQELFISLLHFCSSHIYRLLLFVAICSYL